MLYDTFNYHILQFLKLIIVHHITTVLVIDLTSKRINNSVRHYDKMVHRMTNVP